MTAPTALDALADRCEAATGADRRLDGAIDRLVHDRPKDGDWHAPECAIWKVGEFSGLAVRNDGFARDSFSAPAYTASLDAAMTLIGKDAFWRLGNDGEGPDVSAFKATVTSGEGPTLAFCYAPPASRSPRHVGGGGGVSGCVVDARLYWP